MHDADFPVDVQWTDIDLMSSHLDFTYDNKSFHGLPELVRALHSEGEHYVNIVDPGISSTQPAGSYPTYDEGLKRHIFITKFNSTEPLIGTVKGNCRLFIKVQYFIFKGLARSDSIS
jgi:alpha-glucosidase (family GH31 glycosyl hydrolase)